MKYLLQLILLFVAWNAAAQNANLVIGTYTQSGSYGIYTAQFDESTGQLAVIDSIRASNPSFLAVHPSRKIIVAVNEDSKGMVSSYRQSAQGKWELVSQQETLGAHPCYISMNAAGTVVVVANYSGGSVSVFRLDAEGKLTPAVQHIQRSGSSVNAGRQQSPHAHSAIFSSDEKFVLVGDLGTDEVVSYPFRESRGQPLITRRAKSYSAKPGSGPRHLAFHPGGRTVYLMEEMSGTVTALRYRRGTLTPLQTIQSDNVSKSPGSADIHVSRDGRLVYGSNRADANNISVFSVGKNGNLQLVGQQGSGGNTPRNFALSPGGRYLLAANQNSNNIVVFSIDEAGMPLPTGVELNLKSPVCLKFY